MNNQVQQIELSIEHANKAIAKMEAMERLFDNPDFNTVVLEGYYVQEASRAVMLKGDPNVQGQAEQDQIDNIITGIGAFRQYVNTLVQMGMMAKNAVEDDRAALAEIRSEQDLEG